MKKIIVLISVITVFINLSITSFALSYLDYKDIETEKWYEVGINYVLDKEYMIGTNKNTFSPQQDITRAQLAQVLYARDGKPSLTEYWNTIDKNKWYSAAIQYSSDNYWMDYNDASMGYFYENDTVTREQLAYVLYKYSFTQDKDITIDNSAYYRLEKENITSPYERQLAWAITHGILVGTKNGIEPNSDVTRAQLAAVLKSYDDIGPWIDDTENINPIG